MRELTNCQIDQLKQFIQSKDLEELLVNFVANADKKDFQDWLGW